MTDIFVTGSYALRAAYPTFKDSGRMLDVDIVGTYDNVMKFVAGLDKWSGEKYTKRYPIDSGKKWIFKSENRIIEAEIAWSGSTAAELMEVASGNKFRNGHAFNDFGMDVRALSPRWLYAMKMSHRFLRNSPHFEKTRKDILFLRYAGYDYEKFDANLDNWFEKREKETYDYSHPKLNVTKKDFFKDDVPYKYDHDDIHEAVKIGVEPAYKYFLDGEVKCSKEKWDETHDVIKLRAVMEESMVLALERAIIPFPEKYKTEEDYLRAYKMALQKVCTSITSGWFREYAWEHYDHALELVTNAIFVRLFEEALKNGKIKQHGK